MPLIGAEVLEKALLFAVKAHEGQRRKGNKRPYILHPIAVMMKLLEFKGESLNVYLIAAVALLHDTIEDCDHVSIQTISDEFGYRIAVLVEELTLDKSKYETIGKKQYLANHVVEMSSYALTIKLVDRLMNVEDMIDMGEEFQRKYSEETYYIMNYLQKNRSKITETQRKLIGLITNECDKYSHLHETV